jgi:hypothetical protein
MVRYILVKFKNRNKIEGFFKLHNKIKHYELSMKNIYRVHHSYELMTVKFEFCHQIKISQTKIDK